MNVIKKRWQELCKGPWLALANWQVMRWWWVLSAAIALMMNLVAHYFFQGFMEMDPCEMCVYIRFAMFSIVLGGVIVAINPKLLLLRIIGYLLTLYGSIQGAIWSWKLVASYYLIKELESGGDPFAAGLGTASCSTDPIFPLGLPLDIWFPDWFKPTGVCGADNWSFWGLDMGSWTLIIFSVYFILIVLSLYAVMVTSKQRKHK